MEQRTPSVLWAERPDVVLVTVSVQDAEDVNIEVKAGSLGFTCTAGGVKYHTVLDLKGEVVPEESTKAIRPRQVEMKLKKKEEGPYWEALTKTKLPHVKVNWNQWKDA
eukprot:Sspe_Gene.109734::Locus_89901_Transcript_1_1_Confidence_1.000_Length_368::g.109734::m.109734/K15730/PTGES3; cytosolic prostaglandin-E synthase